MAVEQIMLLKVDGNANNNKFYEVTLLEDGQVKTRWGRVGADGTTKIVSGGKHKYDQVVHSKQSRGYSKTEIIEESSTLKANALDKSKLKEVAISNMASGIPDDSPLARSLNFLAEQNRHQIIQTSGGQIKADDSGIMRTPLGVLSAEGVSKASRVLDKIERVTMSLPPDTKSSSALVSLTTEYFSLVPHKLNARTWASEFFAHPKAVHEERELLRQLRTASDLYAARLKDAQKSAEDQQSGSDIYNDIFSVKLIHESKDVFNEVNAFFKKTHSTKHSSSHHKMINVYSIAHPDAKNKEFDDLALTLGNVQRLWHGTSPGNVLSILREGLYCPPLGAANFNTVGRLFGEGVYLSDISTKSLNYSQGAWLGKDNKRCFMFLTETVMGNSYLPRTANDCLNTQRMNGFDRKKYNSIFAAKGIPYGYGSMLRNNEMIVWNTKQIRLKYLVEFDVTG